MKNFFRILSVVVLLVGLTSLASAADKTMRGQISDSMCGASHATMQASHGGAAKFTAHDCTNACVKAGGQYVFVSGGKVYKIANQDDPDLEKHAGHTVELTGDVMGDTVNVSKVVMPAAKKKAS